MMVLCRVLLRRVRITGFMSLKCVKSDLNGTSSQIYPQTYNDKFLGLSVLRKYVNWGMEEYKRNWKQYFSPYVAICQGSGIGKTATALALRDSFLVFYICLRENNSMGEPPRSAHIPELLLSVPTINDHLHVLRGCFEVFIRYWLTNPSSTTVNEFNHSDQALFWRNVNEWVTDNPLTSSDISELRAHVAMLQTDITALLSTAQCPQTKIVFVFDEARSLVSQVVQRRKETTNSFLLLREALGEFKRGSLFALFIDSSSQVATFLPTIEFDPSAREPSRGDKLFSPFTFLPGQGVLEVTNKFCKEHREVLSVGESQLSYNRFDEAALSRPMFVAYLDKTARFTLFEHMTNTEAVDSLWSQLIDRGHSEVLSQLSGDQKELMDPEMVVMAMRFCLLPMDADAREELVASRLATLQAVSEDRSRLSIRYEAEPILGEVACRHMCDGDNFRKCLSQLVDMRRTGNVGVVYPSGEVGELCCSLLLARAIDKVHLAESNLSGKNLDSTHFGAPVPLRSFLASLLGEECAKKLSLPGGLENGSVRFMQFVKCEGPVTREMLLAAFQRGVALICMNGKVGVNLVLPVVLLASGEHKDVAALTVSDMSGVFVQSRNNAAAALGPAEVYSTAIGLHVAAERVLAHDDETPPFVSVIMDVGLAKSDKTPLFRDLAALPAVKVVAEEKRDSYAKLQGSAEFNQAKFNRLDAKVSMVKQAMNPSRGPTIVLQTLGDQYACVTKEELALLNEMVRPLGEFWGSFDKLMHATDLSAIEMQQFVTGLRPVVGPVAQATQQDKQSK